MPARHALIVGIDQYSNFEERYQLSGCVNDARLIKRVLIENFGFDASEITELHNAAASQRGILDAMQHLTKRVGHDDIVVFHFSGHGSRRTSSNPDEGTGLDSTITPADSGCVDPFPNLDITDDEIHDWLTGLAKKTRYTTLIFDCCHSGTITRDLSDARIRGLPFDRRSLAAMGIQPRTSDNSRAKRRDAGSGTGQDISDSYVVISGCRDDEYSHEYSFEQGDELIRSGALTHFLTTALLRARSGSTWRDVFEIARQAVNTNFPQQHPQIEGIQDREIFGIRNIEPLRFIAIVAVDGDQVTFGGGAAHGLSVGSWWTAYPPGTKQTEHSAPIGTIEITRVGALTAEGVIRESSEALAPGARCVESAQAADRFLLRLDLSALEPAAGTALQQRVTASSLLTLAGTAAAADLRVLVLAPGEAGTTDVARPNLPAPNVECWAVIDRAGGRAMPLKPVAEAGAIDALLSNLESIARFRNALSLDNPQSELDVEFNIFRVGPDGELETANGGGFAFDQGDRLAFEIINREDRNIFVSILDFGLTGKISLLYPSNRAGEMIAAGRTLRIGTGEHRLTLGIPADFSGLEGHETLKAFVSTDEADFRWLQQGGLRSVESHVSALRQQFEAAYHGPATREVVLQIDPQAGADWKAPARCFVLRRQCG